MAVIDIVIPTYRGIAPEAHSTLIGMMQNTACMCRDRLTGAPLHQPWKCNAGKHSVRFMPPLYASSVVHWARNQSVAQAMYGQPKDDRPPAEYFLLMDDDMVAEPGYLLRLVNYKADIVCGICTIRRDPPRPNIRFWDPIKASFHDPIEWDWDSQKLIEIDAAGAAFMLVKRRVFERMAESYLNCEFELAEDRRKMSTVSGELLEYWEKKAAARHARFERAEREGHWGGRDCWWFQFLDNAVDEQAGEFGEDLGFCWKAKKLGFKIYADPQVLPGHLGVYGYSIRDYKEFVQQGKAAGEIPELKECRVALGV